MEIGIIFKIAAVGVVVSILNQMLQKSGKEEYGYFISFTGLLIVLYWIIPYVLKIFDTMKQLFEF